MARNFRTEWLNVLIILGKVVAVDVFYAQRYEHACQIEEIKKR